MVHIVAKQLNDTDIPNIVLYNSITNVCSVHSRQEAFKIMSAEKAFGVRPRKGSGIAATENEDKDLVYIHFTESMLPVLSNEQPDKPNYVPVAKCYVFNELYIRCVNNMQVKDISFEELKYMHQENKISIATKETVLSASSFVYLPNCNIELKWGSTQFSKECCAKRLVKIKDSADVLSLFSNFWTHEYLDAQNKDVGRTHRYCLKASESKVAGHSKSVSIYLNEYALISMPCLSTLISSLTEKALDIMTSEDFEPLKEQWGSVRVKFEPSTENVEICVNSAASMLFSVLTNKILQFHGWFPISFKEHGHTDLKYYNLYPLALIFGTAFNSIIISWIRENFLSIKPLCIYNTIEELEDYLNKLNFLSFVTFYKYTQKIQNVTFLTPYEKELAIKAYDLITKLTDFEYFTKLTYIRWKTAKKNEIVTINLDHKAKLDYAVSSLAPRIITYVYQLQSRADSFSLDIANLNYYTPQGFAAMGYCLKEEDAGNVYQNSIHLAPLRYIFADYFYAQYKDILLPFIKCYGDFEFSHRILEYLLQPISVLSEVNKEYTNYKECKYILSTSFIAMWYQFVLLAIYKHDLALCLVRLTEQLVFTRESILDSGVSSSNRLYYTVIANILKGTLEQLSYCSPVFKAQPWYLKAGKLAYNSGGKFFVGVDFVRGQSGYKKQRNECETKVPDWFEIDLIKDLCEFFYCFFFDTEKTYDAVVREYNANRFLWDSANQEITQLLTAYRSKYDGYLQATASEYLSDFPAELRSLPSSGHTIYQSFVLANCNCEEWDYIKLMKKLSTPFKIALSQHIT